MPNIFEDDMNEENPPVEFKNLHQVISFEDFDYRLYRSSEINLLQPQLVMLGYTNIEWLPGETDSFGPLTRVCKAKDPYGEVIWFVYG